MFNELAKEIHQNAVEHGWWDEPRTFGEIVALCHSELSEALEEFRAGRDMVWYANKDEKTKPEGIAVEMADCVIRILDLEGKEEIKVDFIIKTLEENRYKESDIDDNFGDFISVCHTILSNAYVQKDDLGKNLYLCMEIYYIMDWAKHEGLDMEAIIREKMEYNKTRPYRHGGKVL